ncbi:hypothetical protein LSH36_203g00000 [Paralvinella palmiformis]|uniref:R3H-associated N-terminal domain-containing protein n=1 Tax=Paralvinella palmiformis TaxID=53620 RepID=A0AAD9JQ42_9ANNE|nr:hypothetical protein LSH36_203g00000 [Paralvinella palmiformis]
MLPQCYKVDLLIRKKAHLLPREWENEPKKTPKIPTGCCELLLDSCQEVVSKSDFVVQYIVVLSLLRGTILQNMGITGNRRESRNLQNVDSSLKSRKVKKSRFYKCLLDRSIRAKKKGARQARRVENTNYLLCQSEQDDPDIPDVEYVELMEHELTPFAALFVEEENMQIWNDFINQSEDEQREMLQKFSVRSEDLEEEELAYERQDSASSWEELGDSRFLHPAYSAEECFKRIDNRLKSFLKRRHLPLGTLMDLEEEVCAFFTEWPQSVYVCQLENSFERMLLHALCQYLKLQSSSFNSKAGSRQTQVENLNQHFILPSMTLCDYIEYRDAKH